MKVLIAEDDTFLANAYKLKMEKSGIEVVVSSNGQDMLNSIDKFEPDVIILDLIMPKMDGFSVLEQLKLNAAHQHIPVIVASNLGQEEDIQKAKTMGAKDYLIKSNMALDDVIQKIYAVAKS